eukprot:scaffold17.g587.t1
MDPLDPLGPLDLLGPLDADDLELPGSLDAGWPGADLLGGGGALGEDDSGGAAAHIPEPRLGDGEGELLPLEPSPAPGGAADAGGGGGGGVGAEAERTSSRLRALCLDDRRPAGPAEVRRGQPGERPAGQAQPAGAPPGGGQQVPEEGDGWELPSSQPLPPPPLDLAAVEADPLAALAQAIEGDRPRYRPTAAWQKMLEAVDEELGEAGPSLLPREAPLLEAAAVREDACLGGAGAAGAMAPALPALLRPPAPALRHLEQQEQAATEPMEEWEEGKLAAALGSPAVARAGSGSGFEGGEGEASMAEPASFLLAGLGDSSMEDQDAMTEVLSGGSSAIGGGGERASSGGAVPAPSGSASVLEAAAGQSPAEGQSSTEQTTAAAEPDSQPSAPSPATVEPAAAAPQLSTAVEEVDSRSAIPRPGGEPEASGAAPGNAGARGGRGGGGRVRPSPEVQRARAFAALQPICSVLLERREDAQELAQLLGALQAVIDALEPAGIQGCLDYALFPLLLAVDSIAAQRSGGAGAQRPRRGSGGPPPGPPVPLPAMASDRAAEAALACMLALLGRAHCEAGQQLLSLLQRLSTVLMLPPAAAAEEVRQAALAAAGAALAGASAAPPEVPAALCGEEAAPLVGHLISLLLGAADAELQLGSTGSKAVRAAALEALLALVRAVRPPWAEPAAAADALAFFLPGLVVGLGRALLAAGAAARGPATSAAAAVAALRALAEALCTCLGDAAVPAELLLTEEGARGQGTAGPSVSSVDALAQLQQLSTRARAAPGALQEAAAQGSAGAPGGIDAGAAPLANRGPARPTAGDSVRLRVVRNAAWVRTTAGNVAELLSTALPPLLLHPRSAVRLALVECCAELLQHCGRALGQPAAGRLLQLLLSAAQDEWPQVAAAARRWLHERAAPAARPPLLAGGGAVLAEAASAPLAQAVEQQLLGLVEGLPGALRQGDAPGRLHAKQLTTCVQAPQVLQHPLHLQRLLAALEGAFAFDAASAGLLLHAAAPDSGSAYRPASAAVGGGGSGEAALPALPAGRQPAGEQVLPLVLLPRMPLGLELITTARTYEAVAAACRATAAAAAAADGQLAGTGGAALRSLVDGCVRRLRAVVEAAVAGKKRRSERRGSKRGGGAEAGAVAAVAVARPASEAQQPWQLQAAAVISVLSELLLGASPAWQEQPRQQQEQQQEAGAEEEQRRLQASAGAQRELEALLASAAPELVQESIWELPTSAAAGSLPGASEPARGDLPALPPPAAGAGTPLSAQQLGCNALLQRAAAECCGAAARALGPRFASCGRLLRTVLLPLLEKLAAPAPLAAAGARAALSSIACWGGYAGSLRRLVGDNADYVEAGVAPQLLPLLAEPARSALQGVSILARQQQPQHTLAFLQALGQVAAGAGSVATPALAQVRQLAEEMRLRWEARQAELDAEAAALAAAEEEAEDGAASGGGGGSRPGVDRIGAYFAARRRRAAGVGEESEGAPGDAEDAEDAVRRVALSPPEREALALAKRQLYAAASLAQGIADAANVLVLSRSLAVAVQAHGVCAAALRVLRAATEAAELERSGIEALVARRGDVAPADPDPPRLLPSVHLLWSPLMGALKDWRVSVVEAALATLAELAGLAGSFLTRRFGQDAVPALRRLLRDGPAKRAVVVPGQDDPSSPAATQRVHCAVLRCMEDIAAATRPIRLAGVRGCGRDVLAPAAEQLLRAAGDLLGDKQAAHVREAATQAFMAVATADPDAAWALLAAALAGTGQLAAAARPPPNAGGAGLLPAGRLCPAPPAGALPAGLRACGAAKLEAMLRRVGEMDLRHGRTLNPVAAALLDTGPADGLLAVGAHRGCGENVLWHAADHAPLPPVYRENTVRSFQQALADGAAFLEFDVQVTADGVPVVWHDDYVVYGEPHNPVSKMISELGLTEFKALAPVAQAGGDEEAGEEGAPGGGAPLGAALGASPGATGSLLGGAAAAMEEEEEASVLGTSPASSTSSSRLLRQALSSLPAAPGELSLRAWDVAQDDELPSLGEVFLAIPPGVPFDIEVKMATPASLAVTPAAEIDRMLTAILAEVEVGLAAGGPRPVIFSCFDPDVCAELRARRPGAPVFFLSGAGEDAHADPRRTSGRAALAFAAAAGLQGVILDTAAIAKAPGLVAEAHAVGLAVLSYGALNNDPAWVREQAALGLHAVIVDDVAGVVGALRAAAARAPPDAAAPALTGPA